MFLRSAQPKTPTCSCCYTYEEERLDGWRTVVEMCSACALESRKIEPVFTEDYFDNYFGQPSAYHSNTYDWEYA